MIVTAKQYAAAHGLSPNSVRRRCVRGAYVTCYKLGRDWVLDSEEEHLDHRYRDPVQHAKDKQGKVTLDTLIY